MSTFIGSASTGAWSEGRFLVVSQNAVLPQYCVKCGQSTNDPPWKRKFSWHPQWYFVFILFGILPYAILSMAASKRMVVLVPLCSGHRERYKGLRLAALILLFGCIPEMIVAGTYLRPDLQGLGVFAGIMSMLAGLICLSLYGSILQPKHIDENFGYFRNVNVNFLNMLPPRPPHIPAH